MTILTFLGGQQAEFTACAIRPATIVPNGFIGYGLIGNVTDILASYGMPRIPVHSSAPVAFWAEAVCRAASERDRL
jgi:hypothetical protein